MPRMSEELRAEFLELPRVGVIATLRRDGRPYTVPVWWLWHEQAFWLSGTTHRVWCRQLRHDPRASLCIESGPPSPGHVEVDGDVVVLEPPSFDIWPISRMLARKYVGPGSRPDAADGDPGAERRLERFFANMQTEPRILLRLRPRTWRAIDMSVYRGKRADREFQERARSGAGGSR